MHVKKFYEKLRVQLEYEVFLQMLGICVEFVDTEVCYTFRIQQKRMRLRLRLSVLVLVKVLALVFAVPLAAKTKTKTAEAKAKCVTATSSKFAHEQRTTKNLPSARIDVICCQSSHLMHSNLRFFQLSPPHLAAFLPVLTRNRVCSVRPMAMSQRLPTTKTPAPSPSQTLFTAPHNFLNSTARAIPPENASINFALGSEH
jgi:hypothetical protein